MARSLGVPPSDLAGRVSERDLLLWRAFERLEPSDNALLKSILTAQIILCNLWIGKDSDKLTLEHFIPSRPKPQREQSEEEQKAIFGSLFPDAIIIDGTKSQVCPEGS